MPGMLSFQYAWNVHNLSVLKGFDVHSLADSQVQTCIAQNFHGSLILQILQIFNHSQKYFNENFWHLPCSVFVQWIRETISLIQKSLVV